MAKIATNKHHTLTGTQIKLTFENTSPSDQINVETPNGEFRLNRDSQTKANEISIRQMESTQDRQTYLIDLGKVPSGVDIIKFSVNSYRSEYKSWAIQELNGSLQDWQNEAINFPPRTECQVLEVSRSEVSGTWHLTSLCQFVGETKQGIEDENLPVEIREFAAIASAKGIASEAGAENVHLLIDISQSMQPYLQDEKTIPSVIRLGQSVAAGATKKPLHVSYNGVLDLEADFAHSAFAVHEQAMAGLKPVAKNASAMDSFIDARLQSLDKDTFVVVVSDSMPALDKDATIETLAQKNCAVLILLLEPQLFAFKLGDSPRLRAIVLDNPSDPDIRIWLSSLN